MKTIKSDGPTDAAISAAELLSLSVVIADDEPHIVNLLTRYLVALNHRVVGCATDGEQCIALALQLQPDLIIADIEMPLIDGIEAVRAIFQTRRLPIILSTGLIDDRTLRRLHDLRIGAYLVKPFSPAQLKAAIHIAQAWDKQ
jgi:response regulator NasT